MTIGGLLDKSGKPLIYEQRTNGMTCVRVFDYLLRTEKQSITTWVAELECTSDAIGSCASSWHEVCWRIHCRAEKWRILRLSERRSKGLKYQFGIAVRSRDTSSTCTRCLYSKDGRCYRYEWCRAAVESFTDEDDITYGSVWPVVKSLIIGITLETLDIHFYSYTPSKCILTKDLVKDEQDDEDFNSEMSGKDGGMVCEFTLWQRRTMTSFDNMHFFQQFYSDMNAFKVHTKKWHNIRRECANSTLQWSYCSFVKRTITQQATIPRDVLPTASERERVTHVSLVHSHPMKR